jgi:uncharacterized membrane protein YgcG
MADNPAALAIVSRRSLFWLAWILLAASLLIPAPAGSFAGNAFGVSAFYVLGKAIVWSEAVPGSPGSLDAWRAAILALALFSNVAFIFTSYMRRVRNVSVSCKAFLLVALAIDASIGFLVPEFARLPAYWIWLLSIAALATAFVAFPGEGAAPASKPRKNQSAVDNGEVPTFFWVLFGFVLFWLAVSAATRMFPPADSVASAFNVPLTSYLNDRANLLKAGDASALSFALEKFEKETSNQLVVAIYPRAPEGSVEDFTIRTADKSRLGHKGVDNGAILFLFTEPRAARLEVGYGLESALTDVQAHRILEDNLAPAFARGDYFNGLDATLAAVFTLVQGAARDDRAPGTLALWWRQIKAEWPKAVANAWPTLSGLGLGARMGITFFGSLLGMVLWSAVGQWGRFGGDVVRGVGNLIARRPFSTGMEAVDLDELWSSIKLLAMAVGASIPAAGVVILAAGGAFGGAGALVHW